MASSLALAARRVTGDTITCLPNKANGRAARLAGGFHQRFVVDRKRDSARPLPQMIVNRRRRRKFRYHLAQLVSDRLLIGAFAGVIELFEHEI